MDGEKQRFSPKNGLIIHLECMEMIKLCTDQQAGVIVKMLINFLENGTDLETSDPTIKIIYAGLKPKVEADVKKYRQRCETNKRNRAEAEKNKNKPGCNGYEWDEI